MRSSRKNVTYRNNFRRNFILANQHSKQFKLDAVQYYLEHKVLGMRGCAENLGIGYSTLSKWMKDYRESGDIQDALDVLKKSHQHSGKMTKTIYAGVTQRATEAKRSGRQVSVTRMLDKLGVSRIGYQSWLKHTPSAAEKRKEAIKEKIQAIYNDSYQNYCAPIITHILQKNGETIFERTT